MRGVAVILFVFGSVLIAFAFHWVKRAQSATVVAVKAFEQTGSFGEAFRRVRDREMLPEEARLTVSQHKYLDRNLAEFLRLYELEMTQKRDFAYDRYVQTERHKGFNLNQERAAAAREAITKLVFLSAAKAWCVERGVD